MAKGTNYYTGKNVHYLICTKPFVGFFNGESYMSPKTYKPIVNIVRTVKEALNSCSFNTRAEANRMCNLLNDNIDTKYTFAVVKINTNYEYDYDERSDIQFLNSF